jgi:hypothetical protein
LLREVTNEVCALTRSGEVGASETHAASGTPTIDASVLEEVDAPIGRGELSAHVRGGVDVDHSVAATGGAEHGEVTAVVLDDLGMHAGAAAPEGTDEFADESVTLELTDTGDDCEPGMQI